MNAEIITIGDEILIGQIIDTNSAWIAQQINLLGINVIQITSISDRREQIISAMGEARQRADLILITGGLGPTRDDITKSTLADYFETELIFNQEVFENIKKILTPRGIKINELNRKQAEVPANCTVIKNQNGTAPGMWFESDRKVFISMPGVPFEMKKLMKNQILPKIKVHFQTSFILHKTILTYGTFEAYLAEILSEFEQELPENANLAYLPAGGIIRLRISIRGNNESELNKILNEQLKKLQKIIPQYIFGYDNESLEGIIGALLIKRNQTLGTAESCTGGNIAHLITSVPGSSKYFIGSVVAYSNKIKEELLKVNPVFIKKFGAVSQPVVEEMAKGLQKLYQTDFAIATSGIAGPDGGCKEKPVGTTWIAVASPEKIIVKKYNFGNDRERNIQRSSLTALNILRKLLLEESG